MQIRFLGHAAFELSDGATSVLIDPFLTGNPKAAVAADDLCLVAIVEIANELMDEGLAHIHDPNIGGTVELEWGSAKLVPAWHTSTTPRGTVNTPTGLIVRFGDTTIYHLGDTALFSDLALNAKQAGQID